MIQSLVLLFSEERFSSGVLAKNVGVERVVLIVVSQ